MYSELLRLVNKRITLFRISFECSLGTVKLASKHWCDRRYRDDLKGNLCRTHFRVEVSTILLIFSTLDLLVSFFLAAMLERLRRLCQPALASQTTRPVLAAATSSRALHRTKPLVWRLKNICKTVSIIYAPPGNMLNKIIKATDPYIYTTGRWLNRDKLQREARYVKFDFPALCKKAVNRCSGATKVIRYEKKEGGFNRVFIYTWTMESGSWLEYPSVLQVREDWSPTPKWRL